MGQGQITANIEGAADVDQQFASAHQALRSDSSVQFDLTAPDPPPQPPAWLRDFLEWLNEVMKPVERFFQWLGGFLPDAPVARFLLWTLLAVVAAAFVWALYQRLKHGEWRLPWRRGTLEHMPAEEEEQWQPEAAPVRSWLEEADALAAAGRFAEAIHHLLLRSIEDLARRRPQLVRPALTSRELAAAETIPSAARSLFARIAGMVERALFGGRAVHESDWQEARTAYADFALPGAWRA